jgi:hypothetical protein
MNFIKQADTGRYTIVGIEFVLLFIFYISFILPYKVFQGLKVIKHLFSFIILLNQWKINNK